MKRRTSIALVAALGMASVAAAAPPASICKRVTVTSAAEPRGSASRGFSATRSVDLTLSLVFKDKSATGHVARLKLFTPDGSLYREMAVPIAAPNTTGALRSIPGYPRPVREQPLRKDPGGGALSHAVYVAFPVGGTDIVASGLYGAWRIEAYMDAGAAPCAPAASFLLGP